MQQWKPKNKTGKCMQKNKTKHKQTNNKDKWQSLGTCLYSLCVYGGQLGVVVYLRATKDLLLWKCLFAILIFVSGGFFFYVYVNPNKPCRNNRIQEQKPFCNVQQTRLSVITGGCWADFQITNFNLPTFDWLPCIYEKYNSIIFIYDKHFFSH